MEADNRHIGATEPDGGVDGVDAGQQGSDAATRALALRLLAPRFPGAPTPEQARLLVGRLPDGLPVDVPIPDGAAVVGSLARSPRHISIVIDAPLAPDRALAFYRERMAAAGWVEQEPFVHPGGGFAYVGHAQPAVFCCGSRGPSLSVSADDTPGAATDVRVDLNLDTRDSPCAQRRRHGGMHEMFPTLTPPAGARQVAGGGGGGDQAYTSANLETGLDLAAVADHYARQLEGVGWARGDARQDGPVVWSTWTFRDEDGQGWRSLLFILQEPDAPGRYFLYMRATLADDDAAAGGAGMSASWAPMYIS